MAITVRIPSALRQITGGAAEISAEGQTVGEVLDAVFEQHEGLKDRVCDDNGTMRRFVNVYLNDEDIRFLKNVDTPVSDGDRISIVPAIAGG